MKDIHYEVKAGNQHAAGHMIVYRYSGANLLDVFRVPAEEMPALRGAILGLSLDDIREALRVWDKAIEGDSGDAEYEAGLGLAEIVRALASQVHAS